MNDQLVAEGDWGYDGQSGEVRLGVTKDPQRRISQQIRFQIV